VAFSEISAISKRERERERERESLVYILCCALQSHRRISGVMTPDMLLQKTALEK
jgi:hypothetical protein